MSRDETIRRNDGVVNRDAGSADTMIHLSPPPVWAAGLPPLALLDPLLLRAVDGWLRPGTAGADSGSGTIR